MKKSEFLKKLYDAIDKRMEENPFYENLVDVVIEEAEKLGMMPPDTGNGHYIGKQYMSTHLDYSKEPDYKWDKEE